ncbi:MAG: flavin reductase [Victivallales bacterium]|nr:flavin reductase [Victivallales bacterium]
MERIDIDVKEFNSDVFELLDKWLLLSGGSICDGECNPMTVSWGLFGVIWAKPVIMIAVRPQRHTLQFIEKYDTFTLCALPEDKKDILDFCGTKSGAEFNKIQECALTPIESQKVDAPGFDEAELIIECRKLYNDNIKAKNFLDKKIIKACYPDRDYHELFIAEIINLSGLEKYKKSLSSHNL